MKPWNKGLTKYTHPSVLKISQTMKSKKVDNFFKWRKKVIKNLYKPLKKDTKTAFLVGLILGDGNIQKFPRTERLRIVLGTDKPKLWCLVSKIVKETFNKDPWVKKRTGVNCVDISIYQKRLSERLEIPSGARGNKKIRIPSWIWGDTPLLIACIRGLCEAEASFSVHEKTYTYNFSFSNKNRYLLNEFEKAIRLLRFTPERRACAVRLRRKAEVYKFMNLINFRKYDKI